MRKHVLVLVNLCCLLGTVTLFGAETVSFDTSEITGLTGTPDLANEGFSGSLVPSITGTFVDANGVTQSYTATATASTSVTSYAPGAVGAAGGTVNSDDNQVEWEASAGLFRFRAGFDSGDGQTGEYREQMLTVVFDVLHPASDMTVDVSSFNTAGQLFESAALQFLDSSQNPIGTVSYNGFWSGGTIGSTPGSDPISNSSDVLTFESTGTLNITDPDNPIAGTSGPLDSPRTVSPVADLGFAPTTMLSGYKITRYMEDIATVRGFAAINTSTNTGFTSSNAGAMVSTAVPEPSGFLFFALATVVFAGRRFCRLAA